MLVTVKPPSGRSLKPEDVPVVFRLIETTSNVGPALLCVEDSVRTSTGTAPIRTESARNRAIRMQMPSTAWSNGQQAINGNGYAPSRDRAELDGLACAKR